MKATAPYHPRLSADVAATHASEQPPRKLGSGKASLFALAVVLVLGATGAGLALRSRSRSHAMNRPISSASVVPGDGDSRGAIGTGQAKVASPTEPGASATVAGDAAMVDSAASSTGNGDPLFPAGSVVVEDPGGDLPGYPPVDEPQSGKGRLLADRYGYLIVRFPEPAFIFSENIAIGPVNSKIATTCGDKVLQIGVGEKPTTYLSDSAKVTVSCRGTTRVIFRRRPGVVAPPSAVRPLPRNSTQGQPDAPLAKEESSASTNSSREQAATAAPSGEVPRNPPGTAQGPKVNPTDESVFDSRE
ncbi:MAG: hypothetical protein QM784_27435 [Polyangiaceae bacterium]